MKKQKRRRMCDVIVCYVADQSDEAIHLQWAFLLKTVHNWLLGDNPKQQTPKRIL